VQRNGVEDCTERTNSIAATQTTPTTITTNYNKIGLILKPTLKLKPP
jgi:hypothetical protein